MPFTFDRDDAIGTVIAVDTATVAVEVHDADDLRRLQVNHLVALLGGRASMHLIGVITSIRRRGTLPMEDDLDADDAEPASEDEIRVTLIGTLLDRVGERSYVFRRTLESVPGIGAPCFFLEGEHLTSFMQAIGRAAEDERPALLLGTYTLDADAKAYLDGNRFFQRHAAIVGGTGAGKSWTVARILEQVATLPSASATVLDIHGEYTPIADACGRGWRIAGPADLDLADPLAEGVLFLPYWLLTYEEMLALLLDRSEENAPNQAMLFSRAVVEAKRSRLEAEGRTDLLANFTLDSPVPYELDVVLGTLRELDTQMVPGQRGEIKGPYNGKLTRFIERLEAKRTDRRLGFLFGGGPSVLDYGWMERFCRALMAPKSGSGAGVRVVDFSEVPSDVLPLIASLVVRVVFSLQQWTQPEERHPIALLCDEAHLYVAARSGGGMVHQASLSAFERVAKEGRKYGVALVVISQRPAEVSHTVLSQCNNFVAMRLNNAEDRAVVRGLLPDNLGGFADIIPLLDVGEALVVGDATLLPSRIRVTPPETRPASATVDFWDRWAASDAPDGIAAAVEAVRRQTWR